MARNQQRQVQKIATTLRRTIKTLAEHPNNQGMNAVANLERMLEAAYLIGYRDGSPTGLPLVIADHVIAGGSVLELDETTKPTGLTSEVESLADADYRNAPLTITPTPHHD